MASPKILYVEDEITLANIVKDTLERSGYQVQLVSDGAEVVDTMLTFRPDLCVLDVMLPNVDGFTLGKDIRRLQPDIPVLYLTAKSQTSDVITGFKSGGNDYLRKPFSMEELMLRMDNLLRLSQHASADNGQSNLIQIGHFTFNAQKLLLEHQGTKKKLTYREAEILQFFARHMNGVIRKKDLLLEIWGDDTLYNARNLDVYIAKLRELFAADPTIEILTLRGVGYQFNID